MPSRLKAILGLSTEEINKAIDDYCTERQMLLPYDRIPLLVLEDICTLLSSPDKLKANLFLLRTYSLDSNFAWKSAPAACAPRMAIRLVPHDNTPIIHLPSVLESHVKTLQSIFPDHCVQYREAWIADDV